MITGRIRQPVPTVFLKVIESDLTVKLSPNPACNLWRVDLLGQGKRLELPLMMPIPPLLKAIEAAIEMGKGGGR